MFDFIRPTRKAQAAGLKIIIVGCGRVGVTLVEQLIHEKHDITIIDRNERKIRELTELYDVMGVIGNGASYEIQREAGIESSDLLIAVTDYDEMNLLCCTIAKQVADCDTIARVRTPDYSRESKYLRDRLGLAMILNPELEAAKEAARILYLPAALEVSSFAHGQAELIRFEIPEDNILDGETLSYLRRNIESNLLVCGIERDGDLFIPSGDFEMRSGDEVMVVADRMVTRSFFERIGFKTDSVRTCMIVGGGMATYYLAQELINMNIEVKIIEKDNRRCEELSIMLPKAIIINGDGSNEELLLEEGIEYVEAFVPLTGRDEENIFLTLFCKQISQAKCITKINHISFTDVINSLDLGSVIYPRYFTSEMIVAYVRAKKNSTSNSINTLYHLFDHRAEAIEFTIEEECEVTGTPIRDLTMKSDLLLCFISRSGKIILPQGDDMILPGDIVMVVTSHNGLTEIKDILA